MDWTQALTIIGVNVALIGTLATIMIYFMNKLDGDISSSNRRLDGHATRIDQLYQIIVDLLKVEKK